MQARLWCEQLAIIPKIVIQICNTRVKNCENFRNIFSFIYLKCYTQILVLIVHNHFMRNSKYLSSTFQNYTKAPLLSNANQILSTLQEHGKVIWGGVGGGRLAIRICAPKELGGGGGGKQKHAHGHHISNNSVCLRGVNHQYVLVTSFPFHKNKSVPSQTPLWRRDFSGCSEG